MTLEANKELVRRYYEELWNKWDLSVYDEICTPNAVFHATLGKVDGKAAFESFFKAFRRAFPDLDNKITLLVAEGDHVSARLQYTGTHKGPLAGIPPSGNRMNFDGVNLFHIKGGRIVEAQIGANTLLMLEQMNGVAMRYEPELPGVAFLHVAINASDPERTEQFYKTHFGFKRVRVYAPGPNQVVILKQGALRLELFKSEGEAPCFAKGNAGPRWPAWRHLAFQVDSVDRWLDRLHGIPIDSGPRDTQPFPDDPTRKGRVVWITDPDGNVIELNEGYEDDRKLIATEEKSGSIQSQ